MCGFKSHKLAIGVANQPLVSIEATSDGYIDCWISETRVVLWEVGMKGTTTWGVEEVSR